MSPEKKPDSLDKLHNFILEKFSVHDRLTALAYTLGKFSPNWKPCQNAPNVSKSRITQLAVHEDSTSTFKPLNPSSDPSRQIILDLTLDVTPESTITDLIQSTGEISYDRHCIDLAIPPKSPNYDDDGERAYSPLIQSILPTLIALVRLTIIQLWINAGQSSSAIAAILPILISLHAREDVSLGTAKPDHTIIGAETGTSHQLHMGKEGLRVAAVDRKGKEFVEYLFAPPYCYGPKANTKDLFIDLVLEKALPLSKTMDLLKQANFPSGWQVEVLHLLAQVCYFSIHSTPLTTSLDENPGQGNRLWNVPVY